MEDKERQSRNSISDKLEETPIRSKNVFDGVLLDVYVDEVRLPDGSTSTRDWIKHPGASAVVPVFEDGTVMLLKQYRYPPRRIFAEVPAGKLDPGESPETTAKRELTEESGLICSNLVKTGEFYPAIGYADELIHIYAAWGFAEQQQKSDDDEFLITYRIPYSEALRMVREGEIMDGKTICSLIKTWLWWEDNGPFPVAFT
ncbi:NUDIX domain-containing protein [Rhodohalobacter mucosus]|uniref:GDP-mannose pyrophosphatase n=1 Tax=Rhodohalobacter mucosus TaxID=2079485 RepID=A0A316U015_9BACT|nr:NUDIX hydrolase [Rhodohalobacter mucosus]PWN05906.1 NUDIX domain-containing protein [Rhodohalobacter mucosus]